MPMQPVVEDVRAANTPAQIISLLQDSPALTLTGGLEIVDIDLNVIADISADLAGGTVSRDSYANMHGTANFKITRLVDWGWDLLRPYIVVADSVRSARFNLGVYHPTTPAWNLSQSPPTFEVDGYDLLLRLNQPVG